MITVLQPAAEYNSRAVEGSSVKNVTLRSAVSARELLHMQQRSKSSHTRDARGVIHVPATEMKFLTKCCATRQHALLDCSLCTQYMYVFLPPHGGAEGIYRVNITRAGIHARMQFYRTAPAAAAAAIARANTRERERKHEKEERERWPGPPITYSRQTRPLNLLKYPGLLEPTRIPRGHHSYARGTQAHI